MRNIDPEKLNEVALHLERSCKESDSSVRCGQCIIHLARECLKHGMSIDTVSCDESHLPQEDGCFDQDAIIKAYSLMGFLCIKCHLNNEECGWCVIDSARSLLKLAIADCVNR